MDCRQACVDQACAVQLAKDRHDATGAMHVLDVYIAAGGRDFAQPRDLARQPVNVGHVERHAAFARSCQQVKDRVGRAAHGDVQAHGVCKRRAVGNVARQRACVVLFIPTFG